MLWKIFEKLFQSSGFFFSLHLIKENYHLVSHWQQTESAKQNHHLIHNQPHHPLLRPWQECFPASHLKPLHSIFQTTARAVPLKYQSHHVTSLLQCAMCSQHFQVPTMVSGNPPNLIRLLPLNPFHTPLQQHHFLLLLDSLIMLSS